MLTLEDLEHATVHGETAKEALTQAERRLAELLETKKAVEQKATTLVAAYVTLSVALVGASAGIYREGHAVAKALPFTLSAATFVIGAVVLVAALRGRQYGNLGSTPDMWLVKGRIDGNDASLARMRAYLVHHYANRIAVSINSNEAKHRLLNAGMILGMVGVGIFLIAIIGFFAL
jgi:hypothetical protein